MIWSDCHEFQWEDTFYILVGDFDWRCLLRQVPFANMSKLGVATVCWGWLRSRWISWTKQAKPWTRLRRHLGCKEDPGSNFIMLHHASSCFIMLHHASSLSWVLIIAAFFDVIALSEVLAQHLRSNALTNLAFFSYGMQPWRSAVLNETKIPTNASRLDLAVRKQQA